MCFASSEARKIAAPTMSSTSKIGSLSRIAPRGPVATLPGFRQFTRILLDRPSAEVDLVKPTKPHFEALYAPISGNARDPEVEPMLMIAPPPASMSASQTCLVQRNGPVKFTPISQFHVSIEVR